MPNMREIEAQAKALAPVIAGLVRRAADSVRQEVMAAVDEKDRQIDELKAALTTALAAVPDANALAAQAAALIPAPSNGKDADPEIIRGMVQKAVDALPKPQNGKDADPEQIRRAVADAIAKIPAPKDGASVTLDDVRPIIDEAVKQLRADADSVFAETLEQAQQLRDGLAKSIAELRQPEDGKSVTVDDVRPIIEEAVKREVEALPRPEDGKSVTADELRPVVEEVVKCAVSSIEIPEPRDGEDGRDALQLEILPAIGPDKSYPRGVYAKHAGGLWRSFEQTHGMRGWEVIVEGLAEHRIEQIDERTFEAVSVLSSGAEVRKSVSVPVVIDRGVFKVESEYKAGDGVTWGGSYWIAQKDAPEGKPGEPGSEGWRLAVKKGRDGKDGKNGIDKTAPVRVEK